MLILTAFSQRDLVEQARDAGALRLPRQAVPEERPHPRDRDRARPLRGARALERENGDLAERLEARKIIDRAKGRLMDEHGMTEQAAWRFLQTAGDDQPGAGSARSRSGSSTASSTP